MEQKSILQNVNELDIIEVHNPLSEDFTGEVARSVVVASNSQVISEKYGIAKNPLHQPQQHVVQKVVIKSGQTLRLPGDVAKVVVDQLVRKIMMKEGNTKLMADAHAFMEVERRVVINHSKVYGNEETSSVENRLQQQIDDLNQTKTIEEKTDELTAFPSEQGAGNSREEAGADEPAITKRPVRATSSK